MAIVIGDLRTDQATEGERKVLDLFKALPDEYRVWAELPVGNRNPDFVVLHPKLGVAVLEVKDWYEVVTATPHRLTVRKTDNTTFDATNPDRATREIAIVISNLLAGDRRLINTYGDHAGKSKVPWAYGIVFANINRMFAGIMTEVIEEHCAIYRDSLTSPEVFEQRLQQLDWKFPCDLSPAEVDAVRGVVYPELQLGYRNAEGRLITGVTDVQQEQAALAGLHERPAPREEAEVSPQGKRAAANTAVRMVGGPAGTGKTLVLILRAKYLARLNPTWRITVLTYTRALAEQLRGHFRNYSQNISVGTFHDLCDSILTGEGRSNNTPINSKDRIPAAMRDIDGANRFRSDFVIREIKWMKEVRATERERYLSIARAGLGRPLQREDREIIYNIYDAYQSKLKAQYLFDWEDVPGITLATLDDDVVHKYQHDAILIDEAQDFAPIWFDVLRRLLRPETGMMFLAADGSQRIYRNHSWRSMGLDVVGRSTVLRRSYRNTYEIARVTQELLRDKPSLQAALQQEEDREERPDLNEHEMRSGPWPTVHPFAKGKDTAISKWLQSEIGKLIEAGHRPEEIAIFAYKNDTVDAVLAMLRGERLPAARLRDDVETAGIRVGTMHNAKGLEFRAVFVLRLDELFQQWGRPPEDERRRKEAEDYRVLYVAMTRARDRLFLQYCYPLPPQLESYINFVKKSGQTGQQVSS